MPLSVTSTNISGQAVVNMALAVSETMALAVTLSPLDLTGYEVKMQVKFPTPLVLSTGNGGITLTDAAAGELQINIVTTVTEYFVPGAYPYEFWIVSGGGFAQRLWTGTFTVTPSITPIP